MNKLLQWFNDRTGYKAAMDDALFEHIPSGSRWRYVFGSTLVFAFVTQVITGLFLWMAYSPSSQTAWESVYYIQYEMQGGWLLRAVHHFMAQAMIVLLALHLLQVIIDGAYKAPREVNFWLGLVLMQIVLGLALTGYLLPWDQKGFWATNVATNLMTLVPVVGDDLQKLVVGGNKYGHHTLTRFFALHAGILPLALTGVLALHLALFRKHGVNAVVTRGRPDSHFWPDQILKDAVACLAVLAIVFMLSIHFDFGGLFRGQLTPHDHGAELGAPADPSQQYSAARPEWYFLFLFQLLKYFPGALEIVGAIILPGLVMMILVLMPFIARIKFGHALNVIFIFVVVIGAGALTLLAWQEDYYAQLYKFNPDKYESSTEQYDRYVGRFRASEDYLAAVEAAEEERERIVAIIQHKPKPDEPKHLIPRVGAIELLRSDPLVQGPKLFAQNCLSCHAHTSLDAELAAEDPQYFDERQISAPNLDGFASRTWLQGFLDPTQLRSPEYFGNTAHRCGDMSVWLYDFVPWVKATDEELADDEQTAKLISKLKLTDKLDAAQLREAIGKCRAEGQRHELPLDGLRLAIAPWDERFDCSPTKDEGNGEDKEDDANKDNAAKQSQPADNPSQFILAAISDNVNDIALALSAQARLPSQATLDAQAEGDGRLGRGLAQIKATCANGCHRLGDTGQLGIAPDLTGYGSWEWMMGMLSNPSHVRFYGATNDRMPAFGENLEQPKKNPLTAHQMSIIVDWLRGQYVGASPDYLAMPHTAAQAEHAVELARMTEAPARAVVGEPPRQPFTPRQKVENLFAQKCASCHSHTNEHGVGIAAKNPSAPNLYGFASRQWLNGLLDPDKIGTAQYFGKTRHKNGDMAGFVENDLDREEDGFQEMIIALSAEAALPSQAEADKKAADDGQIETGREAIVDTFGCTDCHAFHDEGEGGYGPVLTGYGSADWLKRMISDPTAEGYYPDTNDRMPRFGGHRQSHGQKAGRILSDAEIEILVKFLRGEM